MHTLPELDQASIERANRVAALKPPAKIHISGICGTGTAAVLALLKQLGFHVTGSDKAFYPPMGDVVRRLADKVFESFAAENLSFRPDLVVIGNSLSRNNPEVEYVLREGLAYASMPEVLAAQLIGSRAECPTSVVVIGTHGKTTTTALITTMLDQAGRKPGYFIGGIPRNLPGGIRPVDRSMPLEKRAVVLEGDEYDSAFFAKWPKFHSYRPDILVVTSLEFDHGDIYESVEQIEVEFTRVARRVPKVGVILVCDADTRLRNVAETWKKDSAIRAPIRLYGEGKSSFGRLLERKPGARENSPYQQVSIGIDDRAILIESKLSGHHNALNLVSAAAVGKILGLGSEEIRVGLEAFEGVLRRQQIISSEDDILVVEDFAHHPTAVELTLRGLKESYPKRRMIAVYEPRSNTSRRAFFQNDYQRSFQAADLVLIREVKDAGGYSGTSTPVIPLDVKALVRALNDQRKNETGKAAYSFEAVEDIKSLLLSEAKPGDLVVIMSNGDFGGLLIDFVEALKERKR